MAAPPKPPAAAAAMGELDPLIGLTVSGRYRVHRLLGQGGMGKVFEAQQIPLGRPVALKVLGAANADASDPEFHKRFFHEAAILAKLKSAHTVTVFDYGRDNDIYFIAMELLSGQPLDRVLDGGRPLVAERAASIAAQICRSLREAHAQGIVHRDLKPANIWLTEGDDGEELVKVLDFGLAKRLTVSSDETNPNVVPGSPKYMAPEAIRQEPIDGRADMYSLGVILFQMLTGSVPFDRPKPVDILLAHLQQPPPPMGKVNARVKIPPNLQRLVLRCLAKQPAQRFANMQELLDALRAVAQDMGVRSDPTLNNALSMLPSKRPPAPTSQSPGPMLRLEQQDFTPHRTVPPRGSNSAGVVAGVATAIALIGVAAYFALRPEDPSSQTELAVAPVAAALPAAEPEPAPPPEEPTQAQAEAAEAAAEPKDAPAPAARPPATAEQTPAASTRRAKSADEADEADEQEGSAAPRGGLHPVQVRVNSVPPGATVMLRGRSMGVTPVTFDWSDESARPGEWIAVTLQKSGYATQIVKGSIDRDNTVALGARLVALDSDDEPEASAPQAQPSEPEPEPADEPADEPGVLKISPQ